MRLLICIDDTDILDSKIGTGKRASELAASLEDRGWGNAEPVTRHQLLVDPNIPYTSHNSTMCFAFDMKQDRFKQIIDLAAEFLVKTSEPGSDPGLCIVSVEQLAMPGKLIAFGYRAKEQVLSKEEAYDLASDMNIHLSEHGGTGHGVIGALAGSGLRLAASDGRLRGKFQLSTAQEIITAGELRRQTGIDIIKSLDGKHVLADYELVRIGETLKGVMLLGKRVLLVFPTEQPAGKVQWQTCTKAQLKAF